MRDILEVEWTQFSTTGECRIGEIKGDSEVSCWVFKISWCQCRYRSSWFYGQDNGFGFGMLGILETLMVVRITSLDWREGWRWSYGLGIQQLELVIEVKEVDTVTKGKNMGEEWRQRPPCEILLLRSSQSTIRVWFWTPHITYFLKCKLACL